MTERRKFHRVRLSTRTILSQQDAIHHGQLQNISMNGALISLDHGTFVPIGIEYDLTVYIEGEDFPLQFNAEVVSVSFAMAGIKFVSYEDDSEARLALLVQKLSSHPDNAKVVLERHLWSRLTDHQNEG